MVKGSQTPFLPCKEIFPNNIKVYPICKNKDKLQTVSTKFCVHPLHIFEKDFASLKETFLPVLYQFFTGSA